MKKRPQIVGLALTIALALGIMAPYIAAVFRSGETGISMTTEQFEQRYCGSEPAAMTASEIIADVYSAKPGIVLQAISLGDDNRTLRIDAWVKQGASVSMLTLCGLLYNGRKQADGINSIVGDMTDASGNFKVLHFEIYNSTVPDVFQSDESRRGTPHLKIYLMDQEETLLFFEIDIPKSLAAIELADTEENRSKEGRYDGFWFAEFIEGDIHEQAPIEMAQPFGSSGFAERPLAEILMDWTISGTTYTYHTTPVLYGYCGDVSTSDTNWTIRLETKNVYCSVNGNHYDLSGIQLHDISFSIAAGSYTSFNKTAVQYTLGNTYAETVSFADRLAAITEAIPQAPAAAPKSTLMWEAIKLVRISNTFPNDATETQSSFCDINTRAFTCTVSSNRYIQQESTQYIEYRVTAIVNNFGDTNPQAGNMRGETTLTYTAELNAQSRSYSYTDEFTYYCDVHANL